MDLADVITMGAIVLLWIAWVFASELAADTRDGADWFSRASLRDRPPRSGD